MDVSGLLLMVLPAAVIGATMGVLTAQEIYRRWPHLNRDHGGGALYLYLGLGGGVGAGALWAGIMWLSVFRMH